MGTSADAAFLISPELALVDPQLRASALAELDEAAFWNARVTAASAGRSTDAGDEAKAIGARVGGAFPAKLPRRPRRRTRVLAMSLLVNAALLGYLLTQSPQPLPSFAADEGAAQIQSSAAFAPTDPAASRLSGTSSKLDGNPRGSSESLPDRISQPSAPTSTTDSVASTRSQAPRTNAKPQSSRSKPARRARTAGPITSRVVAERNVLSFLVRGAALRQFLDPVTKLVRANVAVRCVPASSSSTGTAGRSSTFECQVWKQPGLPSSGATVLYRARPRGGHSINVFTVPG